MNFKNLKAFSLLVFIFVSSGSFAQYKYDIGLKVSSFDLERFQLEQRFHLDNPYTLVVTLANGSSASGWQNKTDYYNDSLFDLSNTQYNSTNNSLKFGVQRKLGFLATDVFYAGATIGVGFQQNRYRYFSGTYSVGDSMPEPNPYLYEWDEISSTYEVNNSRIINTQLGVSFGMDVPISKRFSINAELGIGAWYSTSLDYSMSIFNLLGTVSGGLRYSFGKRE